MWKVRHQQNNLNMYHDNDIYITNIVYKHYEDSIFQRTVPLYATESFIKRVLKRGTSNESRALIEKIASL